MPSLTVKDLLRANLLLIGTGMLDEDGVRDLQERVNVLTLVTVLLHPQAGHVSVITCRLHKCNKCKKRLMLGCASHLGWESKFTQPSHLFSCMPVECSRKAGR